MSKLRCYEFTIQIVSSRKKTEVEKEIATVLEQDTNGFEEAGDTVRSSQRRAY